MTYVGKRLLFYHMASGIYYYIYLMISPLQC